ncbi:MAG TPA: hypothetical protein VFC61_08170, partial [Blastocatellia bacterium]|nr:hypothetical protein [Blastocatellia bacterium]
MIAEVRAHVNRQEKEVRDGFGRLEREMRQLGRKLDVLNQEFLTMRADQQGDRGGGRRPRAAARSQSQRLRTQGR